MANRLRNLTVEEGSLVDRPANPLARVALFKRKGGDPMGLVKRAKELVAKMRAPKTTKEIIEAREYWNKWWDITSAFSESVEQIVMADAENKGELLLRTVQEFVEEAKEIVPRLRDENEVALAKGALTTLEAATEAITKATDMAVDEDTLAAIQGATEALAGIGKSDHQGEEPTDPEDGGTPKGADEVVKLEDILKALPEEQRTVVEAAIAKASEAEELATKLTKAEQKIEELEKAANKEPEPEDIWKGVPTALRKQFEAQQEEIAKLREEREMEVYKSKAAELDNLPGTDADELANTLRTVAKAAGPEAYAKLEGVLKAANEALATGEVFKEKGRAGGAASGDDPMVQLRKVADAILEAEPTLTPEQAMEKAMTTRPDLVQKYREGVRN